MTDTQKHFQELAAAVSAAIVAIGEIINDHHATQATTPTTNDTPLPVTNETPAPAVEEKGRISSRQLAMLRKLCNERLDGNWAAFEASCKARFGKAVNYLTTKEASTLISELLGEGGNHGHQSRSAR